MKKVIFVTFFFFIFFCHKRLTFFIFVCYCYINKGE
nr:MAG TPA: hypothetical protein [Caudoviricetes sp.]